MVPSHGHAEPSARRRTTCLQEILTLEHRGAPDASTAMRKGEGLQVAGPVALAGSEAGEEEGVEQCVQHNEHNVSDIEGERQFSGCGGLSRLSLCSLFCSIWRGAFPVGANSFAKQAEGLPSQAGSAAQSLANEFAPTICAPHTAHPTSRLNQSKKAFTGGCRSRPGTQSVE
ncbi:hypothetical protein DM872_18465 [Pseudomonas taiwanensis]|nr:hypothetical protein [Pseudomonas taiwanensis]